MIFGKTTTRKPAGAKNIFSRSESNGIRYTEFVGDGDSKTFNEML